MEVKNGTQKMGMGVEGWDPKFNQISLLAAPTPTRVPLKNRGTGRPDQGRAWRRMMMVMMTTGSRKRH